MSTFVDTSAYLALVNSADPNYMDAVTLRRALLERGDALHTSSCLIVEAAYLPHSRHGVGQFAGSARRPLFRLASNSSREPRPPGRRLDRRRAAP